jgi:hypothetical protein
MLDGEQLVAERDVALHERQQLSVRIWQHSEEDFWRVQVCNPATARGTLSTTVGAGDSFLMKLIEEAVDGNPSAWHHLAQWGHTNLTRPAPGFRAAAV